MFRLPVFFVALSTLLAACGPSETSFGVLVRNSTTFDLITNATFELRDPHKSADTDFGVEKGTVIDHETITSENAIHRGIKTGPDWFVTLSVEVRSSGPNDVVLFSKSQEVSEDSVPGLGYELIWPEDGSPLKVNEFQVGPPGVAY